MALRLIAYACMLLKATWAQTPTDALNDKVVKCKQSCLGELVCSKTCDFLSELDGSLGSKIEACIQPCTSSSCTNECVFKNVGLSGPETQAYITLENSLSPCYKLANTAALSCVNQQSCLQTDSQCIQMCADQIENPQYVSCVSKNTNTTTKDIDSSNACRQECLAKATDLKSSYSCGVTCGSAYFKGLGLDLNDLNLTDTSSMSTNGSLKRNITSTLTPTALSTSFSTAISPLFILPLLASLLATNFP